MSDLFTADVSTPCPANPHGPGTRVHIAYRELVTSATCRWARHKTWAGRVDDAIRTELGKEPEGESLAHCLSESRRAICGTGWTILRHRGHVTICPLAWESRLTVEIDAKMHAAGDAPSFTTLTGAV